jgi:hypothetical protein
MRNYFSKMLLPFIIASLVYFSINSAVFIKDQFARTALFTFTVLVFMIMYFYYNSNFNQFGNE